MSSTADIPVGFTRHNHANCVEEGLTAADARCAAQGLNMTPVRRKVFEFLLRAHRALGAYAILDLLREAGFKPHPAAAYRALDFLAQHGFVHRIERLNAFVACAHPSENHSPAFMICRVCETVAEAHASPVGNDFDRMANSTGFKIEKMVVEAVGVCPDCIDKADS